MSKENTDPYEGDKTLERYREWRRKEHPDEEGANSPPQRGVSTMESKYKSCERCHDHEAAKGHALCVFCLAEIEKYKNKQEKEE